MNIRFVAVLLREIKAWIRRFPAVEVAKPVYLYVVICIKLICFKSALKRLKRRQGTVSDSSESKLA